MAAAPGAPAAELWRTWLRHAAQLVRADAPGLNVALFATFSLAVGAAAIAHSPWLDEAQSWLLARHAEGWRDLLVLRDEGHPPLYYLILYITRLLWGPELAASKLPTLFFSVGTFYLVWARLPLSTLEKALVSSSYFLLWQYGVFARSYVVGTFFLLLFAALQGGSRIRPVASGLALAAAALTHVLFAIVASFLAAAVLWRWASERQVRATLTLTVLFGAALAASFVSVRLSAPNIRVADKFAAGMPAHETAMGVLRSLANPFLGNWRPDSPPKVVLSMLVVAVLIRAFRNHRVALAAVAGGFTACALFHAFVYSGRAWHTGAPYLLFVSAICLPWVTVDRTAARLLLVVSAVAGLNAFVRFLGEPYTGARMTAREITARGLARAAWGGFPDVSAIATFAVLDRPFLGLGCNCEVSFIRRDVPHRSERVGDTALALACANGGTAYLLVTTTGKRVVDAQLEGRIAVKTVWETGKLGRGAPQLVLRLDASESLPHSADPSDRRSPCPQHPSAIPQHPPP